MSDLPQLGHATSDLRDMADAAYGRALSQSCRIAKTIAFTEAITFALLSRDDSDGAISVFLNWQFAGHLEAMGADDLALRYRGSALTLASGLAECGDKAMAEMVVRAGRVLPAAILAEAQRQRVQPDTRLAAGVDRAGVRNPYAGMPAPPPGFSLN